MNEFRFNALSYALAKQVPAMERGFTIATSYGDIEIDAEDAAKVANVVRVIVGRQLAALASAAKVGDAWTLEQQDDFGCIRDARGMEIVTTYFAVAVRIVDAHNAAMVVKRVGEAWTLEQRDSLGFIRDARGMEIVATYFGEAVRILEAHNAAIDAKLSRGEA